MEIDQPVSIDGSNMIENRNTSSNHYAYEGEVRK